MLKISALVLLSTTGMAKTDPIVSQRVRENVWLLGVDVQQLHYRATEDSVNGVRAIIKFGYGKFQRQIYYGLGVNVLLGPYTSLRNERVKADFQGTGIDAKTSYVFWGDGFRQTDGAWTVDLMASYSDSVGRAIARSRRNEDGSTITELNMRLSEALGALSISYVKLMAPRLAGNTPELLVTRIEGYSVSLGVSYPVHGRYTTKYREEKTRINEDPYVQDKRESGNLYGYSLFAVFAVYLGV